MGTITSITPAHNELAQFFEDIWGDSEGYVYLPTLDRTKPKESGFNQHFFHWPSARSEIVNFVMSQDVEVYYGPAIYSEPSATKTAFKESRVVWCEFDGVYPESFRQNPSLVLKSSSGELNKHVYWFLSEPITNASDLERINRGLTYLYGADTSGWDSTQILRPPTTKNYKYEETPIVTQEYRDTVLYSEVSFPVHDVPDQLEEIPLSNIPDVTDLVFKYQWPDEVSKLWRSMAVEGERSTMLMRLGYYCAEMGMVNEEIYSVIRNADDRWGKFKNRSDRERRLLDLIEKVRVKHPAIEEPEEEHLVLGWRTLLETEYSVEWLLPGVLQHQGYMLLTGPAGVGKTQLSLQAGKHLAMGEDFLEFGITVPKKILMISCEMGLLDLKEFMKTMTEGLDEEQQDLLEQNFLVEPRGEPFYIDNYIGQDELKHIIEYVQPELLIWDSIGSATSGELSSELAVKKLMDFNDHLRQEFNLATWFVHHNRKATQENKEPSELSDVYGNQYLVNRATSVFCMWPMEGNSIKVKELKRRLSQRNEPWMIQRTEGLNFARTLPASFTDTIKTHLVHKQPPTPHKPIQGGLSDTL